MRNLRLNRFSTNLRENDHYIVFLEQPLLYRFAHLEPPSRSILLYSMALIDTGPAG